MAFFDDLSKNLDGIGKKISQTGQEAMNKTKGMADTFKLNGQLNEAQHNLKDIYASIGELYVQKHGNDAESEYATLVTRAGQIQEQIAGLQEEIAKTKGVLTCSACGKELKEGTVFCPSCGQKVQAAQPTAASETTQPETTAPAQSTAQDTSVTTQSAIPDIGDTGSTTVSGSYQEGTEDA